MKIKHGLLNTGVILTSCLLLNVSFSYSQTSYYRYVNPLIGADWPGNVAVGPSCPFGMVKPGPDCSKAANAGYQKEQSVPVYGFSQVHVSGTGGYPKYGNILVMPFAGMSDSIYQTSLRQNETARLGYYSVLLKKHNIKTEITASPKVAFYRFAYNGTDTKAVQLDAGSTLSESTNLDNSWGEQVLVGSELKVLSSTEVCGYNRVRGGWNQGTVYTVYFHAVFDQPFKQFKTWRGNQLTAGKKVQFDSAEKTGALFFFNKGKAGTVQMKIGISFVSTEKARYNADTEIPGWGFETVLAQTQQMWEKFLSRMEIDRNASEKYKIMFYTGLYHAMLMPVDRTGENPLWKSTKPYYDDFYALWDTYRSLHPLITLIDPKRQTDIVNGMLDIYKYDGYLPDARSGNVNGKTQGGSNADVVIADAYVKGLKGIDYELALKAMLKNATVPPGGNEEKEGRGGLSDYNSLGYVSSNYPRGGTRTVEYSFNDYCIATLAKGLGKPDLYNRFAKQAANWQNLWRPFTNRGATGFIMPREPNGKWIDSIVCTVQNNIKIPYDLIKVQTGQCVPWWSSFFYEGSSWEYSLSVPHDVAALIKHCGGNDAFRNRLDTFFMKDIYNVNNEPSFLTPNLYHWIGKPELSSDRIHAIIEKYFNERNDGIPGNDDSGAMSSWLVFHMLGIYPNAGHTYYLINTPFTAEGVLHLPDNKDFKIVANHFSPQNNYIVGARLNNQPLNRAFIQHSEITTGGLLELEMSDKPAGWGSTELPPSMSK